MSRSDLELCLQLGCNVGLITGEASGVVILDEDKANAVAGLNLPDTVTAITGSGGHHYYFANPGGISNSTKRLSDGIDVRADGGQVVFPGSIHPGTGKRYRWAPGKSPFEIGLAELPVEIVEQLRAQRPSASRGVTGTVHSPEAVERCRAYLAKLPDAVSGQGGHDGTFHAACVIHRFGLSGSQARDVFEWFNRTKCDPPWSEDELQHKLESAFEEVSSKNELGAMDRPKPSASKARRKKGGSPAKGVTLIDPRNPRDAARQFREREFTRDGKVTLHHHRGDFYAYDGSAYRIREKAEITEHIYGFLESADNSDGDEGEKVKPTRRMVLDVAHALAHLCALPNVRTAPFWLRNTEGRPDPAECVIHAGGILHLPTMANIASTPDLFAIGALPVAFDPQAPEPTRWLTFLDQLWPNDPESIATLRHWMGYTLTPNTSLQKMLLIVGPKRAGKGVIGDVTRALVGEGNYCGPTVASLARDFGLAPLLGKTLGVVSDARFAGTPDSAIVTERLLCISGEDALTIDRKHREAITVRLPTRLVFLSNELPRIADASGALATRFVVLLLEHSFHGREDPTLKATLLGELAGILNWAIEGWQDLRRQGRFIEPRSSRRAMEEIGDLSSPLGAFVREECRIGVGLSVAVDEFYDAWKGWCGREKRDRPGTVQSVSRNLQAVVPGIKTVRRQHGGVRKRFFEGIEIGADGDNDTVDGDVAASGLDHFYCTRDEKETQLGYEEGDSKSSMEHNRDDRGHSRPPIPDGWTPSRFAADLRRRAGVCEEQHPEKAAELRERADEIERSYEP